MRPVNTVMGGLSDGRGMSVLVDEGRIYAVRIEFPYVGDLDTLSHDAARRLSVPEDAIWNPNFPNDRSGFREFGDTIITLEIENIGSSYSRS
jgi:hypothetical protein